MTSSRTLRVLSVLGVSLALIFTSAVVSDALLVKGEAKCAGKLGKGSAKLAKTVIGGKSKCRLGQISGKVTGSCPDSKTQAKINKATNKLVAGA